MFGISLCHGNASMSLTLAIAPEAGLNEIDAS
jgi:hypothetical protein